MAWGNEDFGAAKIDDRCAVSMGCPRKFAARMRYWLIVLRPALNSSIAAGATSCRADRWCCDQEVCHVIHYVVCNRLDLTRRSVALRPRREQLSFGNRGVGALITAFFFALGFAAWSYSLHGSVTHAIAMFGLPGRG